MTNPNDIFTTIWHSLMGFFLLLAAWNTPKGPPSSPSAQLVFPFMASQPKPRLKRFYPITTPFGPVGVRGR